MWRGFPYKQVPGVTHNLALEEKTDMIINHNFKELSRAESFPIFVGANN